MKAEVAYVEDNRNTVLWFLTGAALGGVVALLLAPEKGKDTRKRLVKQARRGTKAMSESSQEIISRGRELYERGREIAEEAADLFERGRNIAEKKISDAF